MKYLAEKKVKTKNIVLSLVFPPIFRQYQMSTSMRSQVLQSFKLLHRTRQKVFRGDVVALEKGRLRINDEYKSKKNVVDPSSIAEFLNFAKSIEHELKTTVVQACEVSPGKYELNITEDTVKLDNIPFNECAIVKK